MLPREEFLLGVRETIPVTIGVIPFGLVAGVTSVNSGFPADASFHMSWMLFAGASQLAAVQLYAQNAAFVLIVLTAFMVNTRYIMYSAALAPHFKTLSLHWKLLLSYIMVDQAFAYSLAHYHKHPDLTEKQWYYLGTAIPSWVIWVCASLAGVLLGQTLPSEWGLDFAVPLSFVAVLVPALKDRPALIAAIVGGVLATVFAPTRAGVLVGALVGITAGWWVEQRSKR
jgi:4-azaleucine resistance transporter AzlC